MNNRIGKFKITSAGSMGAEEPPGITAFKTPVPETPPAKFNKSLNTIPNGTS